MRVLVVEDNADAREMLQVLIEMAGYDVVGAADGAEAIALADRHRPEVALVDIGLPGIDGCEVCRRLRGEAWGRTMFIAAQTGWGEDDHRRRCGDAGFDAHLLKPVEPDRLLRLLADRAAALGDGRQG